ncbi:hypothetical protein HBB16_14325 [Pseudonocardia sp. MCCB 268]|nr:hypothetical protein [Pseudonocardia cytotoxica]
MSGGERRRLQLTRLLMDEPNKRLLDEPTNDPDVDTPHRPEDLLDGWPGTSSSSATTGNYRAGLRPGARAVRGREAHHLPGGSLSTQRRAAAGQGAGVACRSRPTLTAGRPR